jgi:hypothetical protein
VRVTDTELKDLVRSQAARRRASLEPCLPEDVLRRAAANELDRNEREAVAAHLAICADCVRDYRIARTVRAWAEQAATSKGLLPLPAAWQESQDFQASAGSRGWSGRAVYRRFLPYAIAASLVAFAALAARLVLLHGADRREVARLNAQLADRDRALADLQSSLDDARRSPGPDVPAQSGPAKTELETRDVGKTGSDGARIARLEKAVTELSRPSLNVPVVDLEPSSARGEPARPITTIEVPRTADWFTLILHTSSKPTRAGVGYLLEIVRTDGRRAFRGRRIKSTPDDGLTLALSRRLMPAGKYTINLYDHDRKHTEPIEQYIVEVHYR